MVTKISLLIWLTGCIWFVAEAVLERKGIHKWNWRNKVSYIPVFIGWLLFVLFEWVIK